MIRAKIISRETRLRIPVTETSEAAFELWKLYFLFWLLAVWTFQRVTAVPHRASYGSVRICAPQSQKRFSHGSFSLCTVTCWWQFLVLSEAAICWSQNNRFAECPCRQKCLLITHSELCHCQKWHLTIKYNILVYVLCLPGHAHHCQMAPLAQAA